MSKIQESKPLEKLNADDAYARALIKVKALGFEVWKTRDFAWLIQTRKKIDGNQLEMNFSARPAGVNSVMTLNLSSDQLSEDVLKSEAEAVFNAMQTA